jgi:orotidine-5'-phosphate decarboxylase
VEPQVPTARDALCVALDGSDRSWILGTAEALADEVGWLKIGLEAFAAHGPSLVATIAELGCRVFLDIKLHDIPNTVRGAAANCAAAGVGMFTVHASGGPQMLSAALEGAHQAAPGAPPKVIAVTVLTSLDDQSVRQVGYAASVETTALRLARLAKTCGIDGVVVSAHEARQARTACGPEFALVTPGIRPAGHATDDQRRTVTPAEAVLNGADIVVVGRPITRAGSPVAAARQIIDEMASARSE